MSYTETQYNQALEELFSKHPSVQKDGFTSNAYKSGLSGMLDFDRALGSPWKKFRSIHVAGTNGKGSVCSMLCSALAAKGYRCALYTSPHLTDFRERMKIVDEKGVRMVPKDYVWDFLRKYNLDGLSFFEITTGMAFRWFADSEVDIAVIETGLGGLLDSTNIITPELSIITSIGLDHCQLLGDTRALIARQKAGIFKSGVPALVATRDDETLGVFEQTASEVHCPLFFGEDFESRDIPLDLEADCQKINLRTVCAALELLGEEDAPDWSLSRAAELTGLEGRWQKVCSNPLTICDIGHNPAALGPNFRKLEAMGRPLIIVYGIMADKDLAAIVPLMPRSAKYIIVSPRTSRALGAEALATAMEGLDHRIAPSVAEGVRMARRMAEENPETVIYIGGSTFVVSEAKEVL